MSALRLVSHPKLLWLWLMLLPMLSLNAAEENLGGDFELIDHHGQRFELQQLRGKAVLIFFGYTHCPDICPTELAKTTAMLESMGELKSQVQILFITVDPARDTAAQLKQYVGFFSQDLIGLTGSAAQIEQVKSQYRVVANIFAQQDSAAIYTVDHSVNYYVIDRAGRLNTIVPYGFPMKHLQAVLTGVLEQS